MTNVTDYAPIKYGCNGASVDFVFPWKIFENEDVIVQIQDSEGNISTLNYGADYSVQFEAVGGNVKLKNIFEAGNSVIISRNVSDYQEKSFSTSPGFQASEIEKSLDRVSCNLQEMDYNIENFKETYSAQVGAQIEDLENVIEENKQEVLVIQERFEDSTNAKIDEFEDGIDAKVASVASAADKINTLDESIELCKESAEIATQQAQIAIEKAEEITNAKEEVLNVAQVITESNEQFKNEIEDELENMANLDLSNLTEVGEKHFLNKSQITNCITEIPQRIKLELKDGVLTLKAGSEVIVPNGFEEDGITPKFDYVVIDRDIYRENWANWTRTDLIWFRADDVYTYTSMPIDYCYAGETAPTSFVGNNAFWYDTKNNICKLTNDSGATWTEARYSLPFAKFSSTEANKVTVINQIFNGMGFIGSCYWVDKGVKVLIPDGRNEDGSLKSIVYEYPKIKILNNSDWDALGGFHRGCFMHLIVDEQGLDSVRFQPHSRFYSSIDSPASSPASYAYLKDENRWYYYDGSKWIKCQVVIYANVQTQGGYFIPKTSFRVVDSSELLTGETFKTVVENYVNGTSWYRVWSDGWVEQGGVSSGATKVTFLKAFSNANYTINVTRLGSSENVPAVTSKTATDFKVEWKVYNQNYNTNTTNCSWYACGY